MKKNKKKSGAKRKKNNVRTVLGKLRKQYGVEPLKSVKLKAMKHAVAAVNGDKILAAALLGIGKTSLYRHCP